MDLEELGQYKETFPKYYTAFIDLLSKNLEGLDKKFVFLSKNYVVETSVSSKKGSPVTTVGKKFRSISAFVITERYIFEFELSEDAVRYDVALTSSVVRIELKESENTSLLSLTHALGALATYSNMFGYSDLEKAELNKIKEFFFKKLGGGVGTK